MTATKPKIILDRRAGASYNMKRDQALFDALESREDGRRAATSRPEAVLRIYGWNKPSISHGYGLKPEKYLDLTALAREGWQLVKRPTGGGIVFHQTNDVSFCLVAPLGESAPKDPDCYIKILAEMILEQLVRSGIQAELATEGTDRPQLRAFCFSHSEKFEIVVQGKKLVGFGQKIGRQAVLIQGNLLVDQPPDQPETRDRAIGLSQILDRTISFDAARQIIYTSASAWPMKENAPASPSKIF